MVFNDPEYLEEYLLKIDYRDTNLLIMSSGDFDGMDMSDLALEILKTKDIGSRI
jgi:UDP-N-acetylmuramate: L-alanyl-gamma-D-glutamyl-meso-diaminopimelate ligase